MSEVNREHSEDAAEDDDASSESKSSNSQESSTCTSGTTTSSSSATNSTTTGSKSDSNNTQTASTTSFDISYQAVLVGCHSGSSCKDSDEQAHTSTHTQTQRCDINATCNCQKITTNQQTSNQNRQQSCTEHHCSSTVSDAPASLPERDLNHETSDLNQRTRAMEITDLDKLNSLEDKLNDSSNLQQDSHHNHDPIISATHSSNKSLTSTSTTYQQRPDSLMELPIDTTSIPQPVASPSTSMSKIDSNNNSSRDKPNTASFSSGIKRDNLFVLKRTNFSKSASGSRLISKCKPTYYDCLSQDSDEKKHSNRRQASDTTYHHHHHNLSDITRMQPNVFISTSSFNISSPMNTLEECDAITRRLLSSPIRKTHLNEHSPRHGNDSEKSRRASLGTTNTVTDQLYEVSTQLSSRPRLRQNEHDDLQDPINSNITTIPKDTKQHKQRASHQSSEATIQSKKLHEVRNTKKGDNELRIKQQGRSLSVCDEETLHPRRRVTSSAHIPNWSRAVSLACEADEPPTPSVTGQTSRLLTIIPLFGCDINSLEPFTKAGSILPPVIDSAVDHLLGNGVESVGIFRKSGVKSRILNLRQRIESNQGLKIDEVVKDNEFSMYDVADLVKMWFRELKPAPLMTKELIRLISLFTGNSTGSSQTTTTFSTSAFLRRGYSSQQESTPQLSRASSTNLRCSDSNIRNRIDSLTTSTQRALLYKALDFLAQISSKCESNQMTSQNLAICLTPSLCSTESDQSSILTAQKALEYCIDNHRILFERTKMY